VASSDEQAVGFPEGDTYGRIQRPLHVNGLGRAAFVSLVDESGAERVAIFAGDEDGLHRLIGEGDTVPGSIQGTMVDSPDGMRFNDLGQVLAMIYSFRSDPPGGGSVLVLFDQDGTSGLFVATRTGRNVINEPPARPPVDLPGLLRGFGTKSGATPEDGDLDGDGDVDVRDVRTFLEGLADR
jgi:hypothetical protein